ncbi:hypothetical protein K438DRAFT_1527065, partial [Mycena galopus ATCC 62051]
MRRHWVLYLQAIKDMYLGNHWQRKMIRQFELHRFRQKGHESETPQAFIARRTMWTRMLVVSDDGGPGEVYHIMEKAPVSWGPILILENVRSTMTLYSKVVEHELALVNAWRNKGGRGLNPDNLLTTLKALGFTPDRARSGEKRHVHFGSTDVAPEEEEGSPADEVIFGDSNEEEVLKQAYATLKERKRPPPAGGYPFPKEDGVVTKLGKLPPGPCQLCGSEKHWNRECPNYVVYSEGVKRNAHLVSNTEASAEEVMYQSAFSVLLNQTLAKSAASLGRLGDGSFFDEAVLKTNSLGPERGDGWRRPFFQGMEEVEDEEEAIWRMKPKAAKGLLEEADEVELDLAPEVEEEGPKMKTPELREVNFAELSQESKRCELVTPEEPEIKTEPSPDHPVRLFKRRRAKAGRSALGTSVLSMKGRVGSRDGPIIDLRLDT